MWWLMFWQVMVIVLAMGVVFLVERADDDVVDVVGGMTSTSPLLPLLLRMRRMM